MVCHTSRDSGGVLQIEDNPIVSWTKKKKKRLKCSIGKKNQVKLFFVIFCPSTVHHHANHPPTRQRHHSLGHNVEKKKNIFPFKFFKNIFLLNF